MILFLCLGFLLLVHFAITRLLISTRQKEKEKEKEKQGPDCSILLFPLYRYANLLLFLLSFHTRGSSITFVDVLQVALSVGEKKFGLRDTRAAWIVGIWICNSRPLSIPWKLNASPVNGTSTARLHLRGQTGRESVSREGNATIYVSSIALPRAKHRSLAWSTELNYLGHG